MNWEAIGAVSEGLGALAVLVTLVYLATQVRQARDELRRSLSQGRAQAQIETHKAYREPRVLALLEQAMNAERAPGGGLLPFSEDARSFQEYARDAWGMSFEEATLLFTVFIQGWEGRLQVIPQVEELSDMERHHFESVISIYAGGPGRHFYERYLKRTQHPDALAYLARVIPIAADRIGMARQPARSSQRSSPI